MHGTPMVRNLFNSASVELNASDALVYLQVVFCDVLRLLCNGKISRQGALRFLATLVRSLHFRVKPKSKPN